LHSIEEYRAYLFSSPGAEEKIHFIDAVTTNKTDFFREPQHFKFLQETAFPTLCGKQKGRALNIWSAGCSTGEECYSLAMVAREYGSARGGDFAVLATDISTRVLQHARHGIYEEARVLPVPAELRSKYVLRSKDRSQALVRIHPQLRSKISFHRLNLMDDDYGIRDIFDVVFFRNVMIYFDGPRKEHVIKCISRHLSPGGYLFIGHSESLSGLNVPVEPVGSAVFQKRHA
jgi:chemotaxis protein methyltransferase CheR